MPQPPALTAEQRQAALDKAAKVRRERAEVKEKLKMGSLSLEELLKKADGDDTVGKMKVQSVLESLPGTRQGEGPPSDGAGRHKREPSAQGLGREPAQRSADAHGQALILLLSGPGGAGKGTVAARFVERTPRLWLSRSYTTRKRRPGESEHAYVFVDRPNFEEMVQEGRFLERAEFLGERLRYPLARSSPGMRRPARDRPSGRRTGNRTTSRFGSRAAVAAIARGTGRAPPGTRRRPRDGRRTTGGRTTGGGPGSQPIAEAVVVNDDVEQAVDQVAGILSRHRTPKASPPGGDPPRRIPMARRRPTLMDPPVESLLDKVDSKFTLVALSSKRARQINSYYNQLGESLGVIVPPQVTSVSGKPLTIAFEEIATSKTTYHRPDPDELDAAGNDGLDVIEGAVELGLEPGELTLDGMPSADQGNSGAGDSEHAGAGDTPDAS